MDIQLQLVINFYCNPIIYTPHLWGLSWVIDRIVDTNQYVIIKEIGSSLILSILVCVKLVCGESWSVCFVLFLGPKNLWSQTCKNLNARIKGHLEPTHLKSSPLFTFSTKSLGQDSPSVHLFSKIIGSRFTNAKTKLGEDSPSWYVFSRSRFTFK